MANSDIYVAKSIETKDVPSTVTEICTNAYTSFTRLFATELNIPSGYTSLAEGCVTRSSVLKKVTIPNTVTTIGGSAFEFCPLLEDVVIPNSVTTISQRAFRECPSMTTIIIPNSVTSIGDLALGGHWNNRYNNFKTIEIGSGITSIGSECFRYNALLESVTINATTPPTLGTNAFADANNCTIYVPAESVTAYQTATNWSSYSSRIQAIPSA